MTIRRNDGSVLSANTPVRRNDYNPRDNSIYKVILTTIKYVDNKESLSKGGQNPEVEYEGVTVGGKTEGRLISNIRDAKHLTGGGFNYSERIYRTNSKPLAGSTGIDLNKQDGDVVYIAFINGDSGYPIIIGAATNQLDLTNTGAAKADGARNRWEYNGVFFEIDKDGNLMLTRKGGLWDAVKGFFAPEAEGNKVTFKLSESKLETTFDTDGISELKDGALELITYTFRSGLTVKVDGKNDVVEIVTAGGAKATVNGKTDLIELKDNKSGALKITGEKVALGASSAELLQQVSDDLDKVATWAGTIGAVHTHLGNLGYPTAPPIQAAGYTALQTQLNSIKALVDGIKGTL